MNSHPGNYLDGPVKIDGQCEDYVLWKFFVASAFGHKLFVCFNFNSIACERILSWCVNVNVPPDFNPTTNCDVRAMWLKSLGHTVMHQRCVTIKRRRNKIDAEKDWEEKQLKFHQQLVPNLDVLVAISLVLLSSLCCNRFFHDF